MVKTIISDNLITKPDLVCTYCGHEHNHESIEGKDFIFETDGKDEWCICVECQKECNEKGFQ